MALPSPAAQSSPAQSAPAQAAPGGVNPFIRQLGLKDLLAKEEAAKAPEPMMVIDAPPEPALSGHVRRAWEQNKLAKVLIDRKLLACLRARRGVYSPSELAAIQGGNSGMNIVFTDLTETKCRAASAWVREILLPVGEQPWGIDPTPIPDLPKELKVAVVNKAIAKAQAAMQQAAQAGGGVMPPDEFRSLVTELGEKLRSEAEQTLAKVAKKRSKRMEVQIADRLAEGNYTQAIDGFIEDFVTYPGAILHGPFYKNNRTMAWGADFKPKIIDKPMPWWDRVSPFDAYPAPGTTSPQQGDFIHRVRFRRDELYAMRGIPGWRDEQIDTALMEYGDGHLEGWLWTEAERQRLEQETLYMWLSPRGVIDALNYWGSVPGWKLKSMGIGVDKLDDTCEYECNIVLCGRFILYAALNPHPLGTRPYRKACYDEIPGSFWGRSIPDLAATSQKMCNAIACSLADNLGIASGPQVWVHADRFADGEQSLEMFPWKIWQLKSDPTQGTNPGIGFFQPDDRSGPLMATYDIWERKADDSTGIPRYTYGNEQIGGAGDTLGGLQTLMSAAAKGLRRAIGSCDLNVIGPTINDAFINEMLYNPDESIKGDCVVVPRGAAAILVREAAQQRRIQFLGMTANPIDAPIIGGKHRLALLRETAASMELPVDEVLPSDEAYEEQQASQQQAMQEQQKQQFDMQLALKQQEAQIDAEKEESIAAREEQNKSNDLLADVIKQAVAAAMKPAPDAKKTGKSQE
jgi:hypothetical protein